MNPSKEIITQFEELKVKFAKYSDPWKANNTKLNAKSLTKKEYGLIINELMNFYLDLIKKKENISLIIRAQIDLTCWNLLTDRIGIVIRYPIDKKHFGKNAQSNLQNIYSLLMGDLSTAFEFFRNVYSKIITFRDEKDLPIFKSNLLNFMGDVKKLKLIVNKKFEEFKDEISIEGNTKKDANDSVHFFELALFNNPRNTRIYSNLGYVFREFLEDHLSSTYWFVRALSCIDNDLKKIKDNLEKDFNYIRMSLKNREYIVDPNIGQTEFLKYDLEILPKLFYRIIGILFMNIDTDKMDDLAKNFNIIMSKILFNYQVVPEQYKLNYEVKEQSVQMILLTIFAFHYNINGLQNYPKESDKIILSKDKPPLLSFGIYNHHIIERLFKKGEVKPIQKLAVNFTSNFVENIITNIREDNYTFSEKILLILFYWFSLNHDIYTTIVFLNKTIKKHLQFLNYFLQNDIEIKKFFMPKTRVTLNMLIKIINESIIPVESSFLCFIPMHRFFELSAKAKMYKVNEVKELSVIHKIILIHFFDQFGLYAENDEEIARKFYYKNPFVIQETYLNNQMKDLNLMQIQNIMEDKKMIQLPGSVTTKKIKPLVILDASNIARVHGGETFSCKGIQIVMDFFTKAGHKCISFLPEYLFRQKDPNSVLSKKTVIPDNIDYLNDLYERGLVIKSPPQDYDDSYCIQYAKTHNGYIVTNDLFRDYLEKISDNRKKETERMWIKERSISYTFNKDEFLPNPDAAIFKEFNYNDYNKLQES